MSLKRSNEELKWLTDFFGFVVHGVNQASRMDALVTHAKGCKECQDKLREIVKHAKQEGWQI